MDRFHDIMTIKSKSEDRQKNIIESAVALLSGAKALQELRDLANVEAESAVTSMVDDDFLRFWVLVVYAADIASVPLRESREVHLQNLNRLISHYAMPGKAVFRLTAHGDQVLRWFESNLPAA